MVSVREDGQYCTWNNGRDRRKSCREGEMASSLSLETDNPLGICEHYGFLALTSTMQSNSFFLFLSCILELYTVHYFDMLEDFM
jgi:hypothetical protein